MALALFDLDNTLLDGDSDFLWGEYLCSVGAVDATTYRRENARHYRAYVEGSLDIHEFLAFGLRPLAAHRPDELLRWRAAFMRESILPIIPAAARELVAGHRARGDLPVIVTATNRFVTEPISAELGVEHLLATEPEQLDGHYTGGVSGTPCFREGKVIRVEAFIAAHGGSLDDATFYTDSHNDLPLLERVGRPVAVNADPVLSAIAARRGWPTFSLRTPHGAALHARRLAAAGD
jgi:HAD superfamily hydrolase (TIGR01490 family)